jgi:hypothetical protein
MCSSKVQVKGASALAVKITVHMLSVDLKGGRSISVPLSWYSRLLHGTPPERENWRILGQGEGIHWPDLDEDISVSGLLEGMSFQESPESLQAWLRRRKVASRT